MARWLSRIFGKPDQTRQQGDDRRFYEDLFGYPTANSGQVVSYHTALTVPAWWQCLSLISGDISKLPLMVMAKQIESGKVLTVPAPEHPVQQLLDFPNDDVSSVTFWRRFVQHYLVYGNAFVLVDEDRQWMANLLPDRTGVYWDEQSGERYYITETSRGVSGVGTAKLLTLPARVVVHAEWLQDVSQIILGYEVLKAARHTLGLALAQNQFASQFFKEGGRMGGILELPAAMRKSARDNVEQGFRKTYEGTASAFKSVVLRDGAKFHAAQATPQDAQMTEAGETQARQVARFFNVPPSRIGLTDSSSYNSRSEENRAYIEGTLGVIIATIEAELDRRLLLPGERTSYCVKFDLTSMLRLHGQEQANYLTTLLSSNLISVNEGRAYLNLEPVAEGDEVIPEPEPAPVIAPAPGEPAAPAEGDDDDDG